MKRNTTNQLKNVNHWLRKETTYKRKLEVEEEKIEQSTREHM